MTAPIPPDNSSWEQQAPLSQPDPMAFTHAEPPSWADQALTTPYSAEGSLYSPATGAPPPPPIWATPYPAPAHAKLAPTTRPLTALVMGLLIGVVLFGGLTALAVGIGIVGHGKQSKTSVSMAQPVATATVHATPAVHLDVAITCLTPQGANRVQLCVQTEAGAQLTFTTQDCDGQIDPFAPTSGEADSTGSYQTTWSARRPLGCRTATVKVSAKWQGQSKTTSQSMTLSRHRDGG